MSDELSPADLRAKRRLIATRATLFLVILAAQFLLFEAGLRLWGGSEAEPGFQNLFMSDRTIGYRLRPGARTRFATTEFETDIAVNGSGVRDDAEIGPKAPRERRVVVLGDSIVLAVQVPLRQTFCKRLEDRLNERADGYRYRVIDAGVQGYGPVEDVLFYEAVGARLQPDIVLLVLYVGNDAEEAARSAFRLTPGSAPVSDAAQASMSSPLRRIVRRSMVLQTVRLRVVSVTNRVSRLAPPEPPLQTFAASPAPRIARGLEVTRSVVARLDDDVRRSDARLGVVLMPARLQVDDGDYGRLRDIVKDAGGEMVRDAASARFNDALASLDVPRLDLLPVMRAALPGPDLFLQQTAHLTPHGHAIVADGLARFLDAMAAPGDGTR